MALVLILLAATVVIGALYWPGLVAAFESWSREEYSYGYIVPPIALYLFFLKLPDAVKCEPGYRVSGLILALLAVAFGILGSLSQIADLSGYGLILALAAVLLAYFGLPAMKYLWIPVAYLVFMLPLPQVIYLKLSSAMQLASSELGADILQVLGISVLLEGNVIDLGIYQLQVAEACSGLRYLFPLMSFGFLFAVLYRGPSWHKWTLFLSTVPITIVMNSIRIAAVGVLVTAYGIEMAEGFLHYFQGWAIFIGCIAFLFAEACLLLMLQSGRNSLQSALDVGLDTESLSLAWKRMVRGRGPRMLAAVVGVIGVGAFSLAAIDLGTANATPPRQSFAGFSTSMGEWDGHESAISPDVLRVLAADDYFHANFVRPVPQSEPINLFIAYYEQQLNGRAVHSPEVCLVGGGWEIRDLRTVPRDSATGTPGFRVNRAIIQQGLSRSLVYYWFAERGRNVTNQYLAKWYILVDGVTRHRTDGALVRLVTPLPTKGGEAAADARLTEFLRHLSPRLPRFLPG